MIPHLRPAARGASRIVLTLLRSLPAGYNTTGALAIAAITLRLLL